MQFVGNKKRRAPAIIIVSLIDVLIVVLIFLMITTTFKKQPGLKLSLPESEHAKAGIEDSMVITIPKTGPLHLDMQPLTFEKLQSALSAAAKHNPQISVSIRADNEAPFGQIIKVMDIIKAANIKNVSAMTKKSGS